MLVILFLVVVLFLGVFYMCKKTNLLKDNYLDKLYQQREELKLKYALDPTEENENELKKVNREIDVRLHTDG